MLFIPLVASIVLSASPTVSDVPCQTVADCWLDAASKPIARPKKFRGKPVPRGDCGRKLQWLRTRLACEQNLCTALDIGDKC
jgi:hypothetical protein